MSDYTRAGSHWGWLGRHLPAIPPRFERPVRLGLVLFTLLTAVVFVARLQAVLAVGEGGVVGVDRGIYQDAALRWVMGGFFYYPQQVAGPYAILQGHILYPPMALIWLVPGAYLPNVLWWGIPILVTSATVVYQRPVVWAWPLIGLCACTFSSVEIIASGNPGIWIAMFAAIGTIWRPAFALVLLKPSLFVFALPGIRSRGWWVIAAMLTVLSIAMLPMSLDYLRVVLNARGVNASIFYSIRDVPLMLIPLITWAAARRPLSHAQDPQAPAATSAGPAAPGG